MVSITLELRIKYGYLRYNYWYCYIYGHLVIHPTMEILVGGIPTPLKNMSWSVGMMIPNIWKNKKCFHVKLPCYTIWLNYDVLTVS
jgi:hypothetical protein